MEKDAKTFVQKCDEYQRHAHMIHQPAELLHPVVSPWPFMKWGTDIVGPLPATPRSGTFKKIREREVIDFIITCDNGPQFVGRKFTEFFGGLKIKKIVSTPYHLSANGQAESTNKMVIQNLKKRLASAKGKWRETLSEVLWAYRTIPKTSTGETPFSLVYGMEALIPIEVGEPSLRFTYATEESNDEAMAKKFDLTK
ncbi:uncharacterized protein LOC132643913 [Lycium barbarum]|uniref:uncharacterized protein LOC132643913 n=1 Tax=Lycium barbarum TaxID=112863 RepID=UPI00293EC5EC|nr:uncharacterized protein LOC132643913 [Lycium barbarum]